MPNGVCVCAKDRKFVELTALWPVALCVSRTRGSKRNTFVLDRLNSNFESKSQPFLVSVVNHQFAEIKLLLRIGYLGFAYSEHTHCSIISESSQIQFKQE